MNPLAWVDGYKTYLAGAAIVCTGLLFGGGLLSQETAVAIAVPLLGIMGITLRQAVSKQNGEVARLVTDALKGLVDVRAADNAKLLEQAQQLFRGPGTVPMPLSESEPPASLKVRSGDSPEDGSGTLMGFPFPLWLICLTLAVPAVAEAQFAGPTLPRAMIRGESPLKAEPGEMVILDASGSEGGPNLRYAWKISPELKGRKQLDPKDGGSRCVVATYGGRYLVTLAVSNEVGIDLMTFDLVVNGPAPCPPPEPQVVVPTPLPVQPVIPVPVVPIPVQPTPIQPIPVPVQPVAPVDPRPSAGEFGIAPGLYDLAIKATSPTRVADCLTMAASARKIAAGTSINTMAVETVAALNTLPAGWEALKTSVKDSVTKLASAGKLKAVDDMRRLLVECAGAFEAAAKAGK